MHRPQFVSSGSLFVLALALAGSSACSRESLGDAPKTTPVAPMNSAASSSAPAAAAATPGGSVVLGKTAPDFTLKDLDGREVSLTSFRGQVVVLEWFNPGCPYVKASHTKGSLKGEAKKQAGRGVVWLAINSGAHGKQGYELAVNVDAVKTFGLEHPVLRDETGRVGRAYGATNTPHMFVIDKSGTVVYAGAIDNSPDGEGESPTGGTLINYVSTALEDLAAGRPIKNPASKAYGCSVKYAS